MLEREIEGKLTRTLVPPADAVEHVGEDGELLSLSASWHRDVVDGEEVVDMAEFVFLIIQKGKPVQLQVDFENGEFTHTKEDLSGEMGDMKDEEEFIRSVRFITDGEALRIVEQDERVKKALKKAKHLRVYSMDFMAYDEDYEAPVWHLLLKNWPLTNHFKKEKPITVEAVVEGTRGKIATLAVYS